MATKCVAQTTVYKYYEVVNSNEGYSVVGENKIEVTDVAFNCTLGDFVIITKQNNKLVLKMDNTFYHVIFEENKITLQSSDKSQNFIFIN